MSDTAVMDPITTTDEMVKTETSDEPEEASHIVLVPPTEDDTSPQGYVLRARVEGFPITAICGYAFIPIKNPEPLPVCSGCLDVFRNDPNAFNDREELPDA